VRIVGDVVGGDQDLGVTIREERPPAGPIGKRAQRSLALARHTGDTADRDRVDRARALIQPQ
jgi:hypothetical protein